MLFHKKKESKLKVELVFQADKCSLIFSGKLDRMDDPKTIRQHLEEVWKHNIKELELDCRHLRSASQNGELDHHFLALVIEIKTQADEKAVKLVVHLQSRKQIEVFKDLGRRLRSVLKLEEHLFLFDNPD